ncbi:MAG: bifunctional demethylmenaquinone methyltransferase/2-methoxy-6-polyprenyl-1,4-benzoquinol methylase UbiE [Actinomycetota bacterium]|nr:bifunctional demethylmenaquinone methyltransferase/2-methoxy-6-polyprenyl-1,4-benzoquinol methylase UbiE [Actinomycetota bacterium]
MSPGVGKEERVRSMFSSIAERYDLTNALLSFGLHRWWRSFAVQQLGISSGSSVIDICSGTGDLAVGLAEAVGDSGKVTAVDFCGEMIEVGRRKITARSIEKRVEFVEANAEDLPFPADHFDGVIMGFGARNVAHLDRAFGEMLRVIKPGARAVCLEFAGPSSSLFGHLYRFYLFEMLPLIGGFITGDMDSYKYLAESIDRFHHPEELKEMMEKIGFLNVRYFGLTCGVVTVHVGKKTR